MTESLTFDLVIVGYAIAIIVVFALGRGSFVYPASAASLALVWQALDWQGSDSIRVLASVASAIGLGILVRKLSGKPLVSTERDGTTVLIATGVFGAVFLPITILGAAVATT